MVIKVTDHVRTASTYEDGDVIFRLLLLHVRGRERVEVDFTGITSVPSAFVNAAFIRLLEHVPFQQVRESLRFTKTTRQINDLIRSRFDFVARQGSTS
jgi:hypothetical protein